MRVATYYDKKVKDDVIPNDTYVYVYIPRNHRLKMVLKWHGPFKVLKELHPLYEIELISKNGKHFSKYVTRDKIRKAERTAQQEYVENDNDTKDVDVTTDKDGNNDDDFITMDRFENENNVTNLNRRGVGRYNLRANPSRTQRGSDYELYILNYY